MYATSIPAGRLTIRSNPHDATSCELWLNEQLIGRYGSAGIAAEMIRQRRSGCSHIDTADVSLPQDLEGWEWVSVNTSMITRSEQPHPA